MKNAREVLLGWAEQDESNLRDLKEIIKELFGEDPKEDVHEQKKASLKQRITDMLIEMGIPANIKGFNYVRRAIELVYEQPDMKEAVTKVLYPTVAKEFDTTSSRTERSIRHAVETGFNRMSPETHEKYFKSTVDYQRGKPTNSEFIALLADKLRLEDGK